MRSRSTSRWRARHDRPRSTIRGPTRWSRSMCASAPTTCSLPRTRITRCTSPAIRMRSAGSIRASGTRPRTSHKAQGWCPMIVDTNGDGKIGEYTNPGRPADPNKDMRVSGFPYGIIVNPKDGSVWWATSAATIDARGGVPGPNRPHGDRVEPAVLLQDGDLRAAVLRDQPEGLRRLHAARSRRRSQRGSLDRALRWSAHGQLRSHQVQDAERTESNRPAV